MSIQLIKKEVTKLNKQEQAELMHFMVELLATDSDSPLSDDWKEEIEQRTANLESGKSVGRPARDVLAKYS